MCSDEGCLEDTCTELLNSTGSPWVPQLRRHHEVKDIVGVCGEVGSRSQAQNESLRRPLHSETDLEQRRELKTMYRRVGGLSHDAKRGTSRCKEQVAVKNKSLQRTSRCKEQVFVKNKSL